MSDAMGHAAVFGATGGGKTSFPPMLQFEFHAYAGDESGVIAAQPTITTERMASHNAARAKAGRIAKQIGGPVDLALAGAAHWDDRYIPTASPSEHPEIGRAECRERGGQYVELSEVAVSLKHKTDTSK